MSYSKEKIVIALSLYKVTRSTKQVLKTLGYPSQAALYKWLKKYKDNVTKPNIRAYKRATANTNIALYHATLGYSNLKINNSRIDTFKAVHEIIGNGPVVMIAGGTKRYFQDRGYSLTSSSAGDFSGIMSAVDNNRIQGILLADGIDS